MKLFLLEHLNDETKDAIQKEQQNLTCSAINDSEYEDRYELIITLWRLETELIMAGRKIIKH